MSLENKHLWEFGGLRFESERQRLVCGGEVKTLPPKVSTLLLAFVRSEGRVLKKDELLATLWPDTVVEESNLSQSVFLLRKAFKECGVEALLIEAIPKVGYRFLPEVRPVSAAPEPEAESEQTESPSASASPVAPVAPVASWWRGRAVRRPWQLAGGLAVLALVGLLAGRSLSGRSRGPLVASVAVLPFVEMNADKPDPALSLGLADLLISRLGAANAVEVRPTAAVLRYLEKTQDALGAGRELGVEAVITGRIYRQGDSLRLTCQLVRVSDARTLWTTTFERSFANLFEMEETLANEVASALAVPLPESGQSVPGLRGTRNLAAYQLYLKGRYFWNKRAGRAGGKQQAIESFEQAIQLDPSYAEAYAGLADCYSLLDAEISAEERLAKALPAVTRALELNDRLAEAHTSLGFLRYKLQFNWAEAETSFKRALQLNPNYATAWHWYGEFLSLQGRGEEALRTMQQAERLDPLSLPIKNDLALVRLRLRQYDQALAKFQEALALDPQFNRARFGVTLAYLLQGREAEAIQANLADLRGKNTPPETLSELEQTLQQGGHQAYWQKFVELKEAGKLRAGVRLLTLLRLRAGETERALAELEKSVTTEGEGRLQLKASPEFDPLRQHPRFQQLLREAGFSNR